MAQHEKRTDANHAKELNFPYPISANRYWRKTRTGRVYVSEEAKAYKSQVYFIAQQNKVQIATGAVSMTYRLHPKKNKDGSESKVRLDLDNALKVVNDALNGIAYVDDRQIRRIVLEFGEPIVGGGITVFIEEVYDCLGLFERSC